MGHRHKRRIFWLQARPITRLSHDPCALDTDVEDPDQVFTRCNVGEMFPGACTPLSLSFTGRAIDVGMQRMHQRVGIQRGIREDNRFIAIFDGPLRLRRRVHRREWLPASVSCGKHGGIG